MGRFYYFDSVCTFSYRGTSSYSTSSLQIEDPGYFCGNPDTAGSDIFTITGKVSKSAEKNCGLLAASETSAETIFDDINGNTIYGGTYASSRADVTSPTYSWSDPSTSSTATGGQTLITTALTSVTYSAKETTTMETGTFYFDDGDALYLDTDGTGIPVSVVHSSSVIPTTTQSSYTLTGILTTATGYHFAFRLGNAQAAWHLEPLEPAATGRLSPAFSASSPQPSASSFSATALSGTHSFVSLSMSSAITSGQTVVATPLRTGSDDCGDGLSETTQTAYTGPILYTYQTAAVSAEDMLILRRHLSLTAPRQMPETGLTGISGRPILAGLSASPYSYSFVAPIVGLGLNSGLIGISCLNVGTVLVPYWFRGSTTGVVGGSKATLSWVDGSSLTHTRIDGTASTVTATVAGIISFATSQTDISQVTTASYTADIDFHRPPLQRSTGTLYAGAESYGVTTSGSYRIVSTDSSGSTSSFTTSGSSSRSLESTDWSRPIRKEVQTYAYTTSSSSMTVDQTVSHALPVHSGYYGPFYHAPGTSQMLAEEATSFHFERTAAL